MKVSFFPGCSLEGTAREYGESIEAVCKNLDIDLEELPDWNCCGASSAHCTNEFLSVALPARNLALAEESRQDLVTPCAACFSRLKTAEKALAEEKDIDLGVSFRGDINILHILELFCRDELTDHIEQQVTKPLAGLKTVCYYGCLLVRPPKIVAARHWEDPHTLDRLMTALGAESIHWPYKTECCGGSMVLTNTDIFHHLIGRILDMAIEAGAECIVTACPLCMANLDTREEELSEAKGTNYNLPVFYFTELMGLAFGDQDAGTWFNRHIVDPTPLLKAKGLL